MFVTCHGSGGEQLQGPEISVLVGEFFLAVGVNREVDGGEGDVTQEASFGSLMVGIKKKKKRRGGEWGMSGDGRRLLLYIQYSVKWLR